MNSEFLPEAEDEFREATRFYETKAPGVGVAFVAEVRRAVRSMIENPYVRHRSGRHRNPKESLESLSLQRLLCCRAELNRDRSRRPPEETAKVLANKDQTNQETERLNNGLKTGNTPWLGLRPRNGLSVWRTRLGSEGILRCAL